MRPVSCLVRYTYIQRETDTTGTAYKTQTYVHVHMFNTPRSRSVAGDAKTGPELLENRSRQSFCHDIDELLRRRDVQDPDAPKSHLLTNKVYVELNVLRSAMVDRVGGEVHSGDVVAVDEHGLVNITKQLLEQLTKPRAFGNGVSHCPSLCLGTQAGDSGLSLG